MDSLLRHMNDYFRTTGFLLASPSGWVLSRHPGGWIFPLVAGSVEVAVPQESALPQASPTEFRILMAEDSKEQQVFVRFLLKGTRYSIDFADNGIQAVERFQERHYDLVFMDMRMPLMDGREATRQIREWEKHRGALRVPIIALTGMTGPEEVQKCLDAGCTGHLAKPFSHKEFFKKLK